MSTRKRGALTVVPVGGGGATTTKKQKTKDDNDTEEYERARYAKQNEGHFLPDTPPQPASPVLFSPISVRQNQLAAATAFFTDGSAFLFATGDGFTVEEEAGDVGFKEDARRHFGRTLPSYRNGMSVTKYAAPFGDSLKDRSFRVVQKFLTRDGSVSHVVVMNEADQSQLLLDRRFFDGWLDAEAQRAYWAYHDSVI